MTATNANGTTTASPASASVTATTVPQAPTIGTVTDGGTGTTVSVPFTAGATGGSAITGYSVTSSPATTTQSASSSPYTFTGLTAGTAYTFTVTATNTNGTSAASSASNSVTPAEPTSMVLLGTVTVSGATSSSPLYISFTGISQSYKHVIAVESGNHYYEAYSGPIVLPASTVGDDYGNNGISTLLDASNNSAFTNPAHNINYYYYYNVNTNGGAGGTNNGTYIENHSMLVPNYNDTSISRAGLLMGGSNYVNTDSEFPGVNAVSMNEVLADTRSSTSALTSFDWAMYSGGPSPTNPFRDGSVIRLYGLQ
jgi:hypothetical protein